MGAFSTRIKRFLKTYLDYKALSKRYSTITSTLLGNAHVVSSDTGVIHPSYNHALTKTSRLSSSNPNMQNVEN